MDELSKAIAQALALAARLRAISEKTKDAEFKGTVANLLLELADVQIKVDALMGEHVALKAQLLAQAPAKVELCPRCGELGWKVISTKPHKSGRIAQTYACPKCKLKEEVLVAT